MSVARQNGVCQWFSTIGGLGRPKLRVLGRAPASRLGGGAFGHWLYDGVREAMAGSAAVVPRRWTPPSPPKSSRRIIIIT